MSKQSYSEKLRDPRWQKKRLEILNRSNFTCEDCGAADKTLHVHHCLYHPNSDPWEYNPNELRALCEDCHDLRPPVEHDVTLEFKRVLAFLTIAQMEELMLSVLGASCYLSEHGKGDTVVLAAPHALREQPAKPDTL